VFIVSSGAPGKEHDQWDAQVKTIEIHQGVYRRQNFPHAFSDVESKVPGCWKLVSDRSLLFASPSQGNSAEGTPDLEA